MRYILFHWEQSYTFCGNIYRALHTKHALFKIGDNILIALYLHLFAHIMPLAVDKKTYFIGGITNCYVSIPDYSINKKGNVFFLKLCSHWYLYLPLVDSCSLCDKSSIAFEIRSSSFALLFPPNITIEPVLILHHSRDDHDHFHISMSSAVGIYCCVFLHRSLLCW